MEKRGKMLIAVIIAAAVLFLLIMGFTGNLAVTGNAASINNKGVILVKFYQNPNLMQTSFYDQLIGKPKIVTKFSSINNLIKKYDLSDSASLFNDTALKNVYQFRVSDVSSAVAELKQDSNVEYARAIELGFDKQIIKQINDLNVALKKENASWQAGYTLQSVYTDKDKTILAGTLAAAGKGNPGKSSIAVCNDSDSGKNYNVQGTTCSGTTCKTDSCSGSILTEYSCNKGNIISASYTCPGGCSNGACIPVCVPSCSGKTCGANDGCNGTCLTGSCPAGQSCNNGACISLNLPLAFDWRNASGKNYITPIENQGQCGSCWDFAAVGAVEGEINAYYNNASINKDLSEQDILSCSGAGNCEAGGYPSGALSYIQSTGVAEASCFPYTTSDNNCLNKCSTWQQNAWKISSSTYIYGDDVIKKALLTSGPLVTTMNVFNDFYYYSGGTYNTNGLNYVGGHAIVIVGYGNDANNKLYWICKNSWGTGWGESGYFRIYADTSGIGGETYSIASPIPPTAQPQSKVCEDKDADGYCYWGLGSKPSNCPAACLNQSTEDCNDANAGLNAKC